MRPRTWGDRRLVPREWVQLATRRHIDCVPFKDDGSDNADFSRGYGYQFWMSRHGFHGHGAFGQQCVVVPSQDIVIAVTAQGEAQEVLDAVWECLLPGVDHAAGAWQGDVFTADLYVITTPHRVRLVVDAAAGIASATWGTLPLTSLSLTTHLRSPLMTRPDVA
jgi:CubicO group peptidase (beta-lactamase class C family)